MAGAPIGNNNGAKPLLWRAAIHRALAKRSRLDAREALDDLAEKLLKLADEGEISALKELGDRLDGKAAQSVAIGGDPDAPPIIQRIERHVIRGNAAD